MLTRENLNMGTLFQDAMAAREMLEHAWSPQTAYQGITLQPDDRPSRGQCDVTSLWYARRLRQKGIDAYFTEGIIHLSDIDDDHVWVEVRRGNDMPPILVDLTSDQYKTLHGIPLHVGERHYNWEPRQYFDPAEVPRKKLLARFAILEANIAKLPRRHRLKD